MDNIVHDSRKLTLEDFCFSVPASLVAQAPAKSRSDARLLHYSHASGVQDYYVTDLPSLLPEGALLVLNDSRVFPGRLQGQLQTGGKAEIFLLHKPEGHTCAEAEALGKPYKKLQHGTVVYLPHGVQATVTGRYEKTSGVSLRVRFNVSEEEFLVWAENSGQIPLPPYIKREKQTGHAEDKERYQTVYARPVGSVAAPTAGLHMDEALMEKLKSRGVEFAPVTLHVGAGTFLPVRQSDIDLHEMHSESFYVPTGSLKKILQARKENRPVIAVGTTSFRCMESLFFEAESQACDVESLSDRWLDTRLFVRPSTASDRYSPKVFSGIQTNFHQPESTLFMLICSLVGFSRAHEIYQHAVSRQYRFFSYGDSSLLWF